MELIRGINNIKPQHKGCVVTIGNFDGVHLGHQALLKQLVAKGSALNLPTTVIIFEPQPNEFFHHEITPPRLMRLREKLIALQACGIDRVLCLRFNQELAAFSAEHFVTEVLVAALGVRYIIIGDDFHFGYERLGNLAMLERFSASGNFAVEKMEQFIVDDERVSSTRIRKFLQMGDLKNAEKLLGRPYSMAGRIAHGHKRGRIIGFPTANIYLHRRAVSVAGVYVVRIKGLAPTSLQGVANVGTRPTVDGGTKSLLEVHIFDFDEDIYGRHVEVEFIYKLRDEKHYASFELLKQQILKDAELAKKFFAQGFAE